MCLSLHKAVYHGNSCITSLYYCHIHRSFCYPPTLFSVSFVFLSPPKAVFLEPWPWQLAHEDVKAIVYMLTEELNKITEFVKNRCVLPSLTHTHTRARAQTQTQTHTLVLTLPLTFTHTPLALTLSPSRPNPLTEELNKITEFVKNGYVLCLTHNPRTHPRTYTHTHTHPGTHPHPRTHLRPNTHTHTATRALTPTHGRLVN